MKLFFVLSEDRFFKPAFLEKIIQKREKDIVGIAIISARSPKFSVAKHYTRYLKLFGFWNFFVLGVWELWYTFLDFLSRIIPMKKHYSTRSVCKKYGIKTYFPKDVNSKSFLEELRSLEPDIVISSCAQIFKKDLLNVPKVACINRHTSLLPQYKGVWPVFWAMLHDEKEVGASIHEMTPELDGGRIVTQARIPIEEEDSMYKLYEKGLIASADLILEAIDIIEHKNEYKVINENKKSSYFGFPTLKDSKLFLKKRKKYV